MNFGTWIRTERERRGLSQAELARRIGIKAPYLSRLENSMQDNPGGKVLAALARVFGLSVDEVYAAAGLGPVPPPRTPTPADLRAHARAAGVLEARTVAAALAELTQQYEQASDQTWHTLCGMYAGLVQHEADERQRRAQGPRGAADPAGGEDYGESRIGGSWSAWQPVYQHIEDERGEYHAPPVGCR